MATLSPLLLNSRASSSFAGEFPAHSIRLPAPATAKFRPRYNQLTVKAAVSDSGIYLLDNDEAEKVNRLKLNYLEKIVPVLKQEFKYTNVHQIPKVKKIVVNVGMGDAAQNAKGLDAALNDLAMITGQRPVKTTAKNAIAAFKIREGQTLGIAVTLRRDVMYAFLDRLINLGLPRVKDFQGVSPNCFDGHGNYSIGLQELTVFPELGYDAISRQRGMNVCITTTATTDKEGFRLLALMGMPFTEGTAGQETFTKKKKLRAHHFDSKAKQRSRR